MAVPDQNDALKFVVSSLGGLLHLKHFFNEFFFKAATKGINLWRDSGESLEVCLHTDRFYNMKAK